MKTRIYATPAVKGLNIDQIVQADLSFYYVYVCCITIMEMFYMRVMMIYYQIITLILCNMGDHDNLHINTNLVI